MTITTITAPADPTTTTTAILHFLSEKRELRTIICSEKNTNYEAKESTIYRDRLSVSRTTTGSMLQPVSSIGMSIPLVVVSMHLNTSGCHRTNVMNGFTSITAFCHLHNRA